MFFLLENIFLIVGENCYYILKYNQINRYLFILNKVPSCHKE